MLREKELGCFLIRLSDKAIGYILSYKWVLVYSEQPVAEWSYLEINFKWTQLLRAHDVSDCFQAISEQITLSVDCIAPKVTNWMFKLFANLPQNETLHCFQLVLTTALVSVILIKLAFELLSLFSQRNPGVLWFYINSFSDFWTQN